MTGTEAVRRLRAAGWQLVRSGKHAIMQKDGRTLTVSLGAKMSRQAESGIKRALLGRLTATQGWQQRTALLVLVLVLGLVAALLPSCNYDVGSVPRPDGLLLDGGNGELGKQPPERPPIDGGVDLMLDAMPDSMLDTMPMPDATPEAAPVDVMPEAPSVPCDEVNNTGCAAPLKCGFSCSAGGFTCIATGTHEPGAPCYSADDSACGAGFACSIYCLRYCRGDADCVGAYGSGVTSFCKPPLPVDAGCSRPGFKVCQFF